MKAVLERTHAEQAALCDQLEKIADDLPDQLDRQVCLHLSRAISSLLQRGHRAEEDLIFAVLVPATPGSANRIGSDLALNDLGATLDQLRLEHFSDQCFAEELGEALLAAGTDQLVISPNAMSYMLRGFFEGVRRHLVFERTVLLPILKRY
ncbi:MAG: hemerythrin domain-containing protein [Alphaproteobacteria bacterium]|nr:hemerythrin domain-containing protein [Alphaproteobacteria bacterium]